MRVAIIGGGASGLVASIYAKCKENEVVLFEKNKTCGKKLLVTGNGRCNYWNEDQRLMHYHSIDAYVLPQIITEENQKEILNFFTRVGVIPKIKNGYYYPYSNQASSIRNVLLLEAQKRGVTFCEEENVVKIEKENEVFFIYTEKKVYCFDKVVLATGSNAFLKNSEMTNGYQIAQRFNLEMIPSMPSLVQLISKGTFLKKWAGIRCDAKVSIYANKKLIKEEIGEVQLTDYGISGICVFNLSRYASRGLLKEDRIDLKINFLPFIEEDGKAFLTRQNKIVKNRTIQELLECILNYKLIETILGILKIDGRKNYLELKGQEKEALAKYLTEFPLQIIGTKDFLTAQVSSGGVRIREINPQTMEALKVENLYVIGELLDVDGDCGGYNLGFAWMSGMLAGKDISKNNIL